MSNLQLHQAIDTLPPHLQQEVATYVALLRFKYENSASTQSPKSIRTLKFGVAKGLIRYADKDWDKDLDQEFDMFNGNEK